MKGTDLGMESLCVWTLSLSSSEETLAALPLHRRGEGWVQVDLHFNMDSILNLRLATLHQRQDIIKSMGSRRAGSSF